MNKPVMQFDSALHEILISVPLENVAIVVYMEISTVLFNFSEVISERILPTRC